MDRIDERRAWLILPNAKVDVEARRQDEARRGLEKAVQAFAEKQSGKKWKRFARACR